jgi:hypothetical protein
MARTPEYFSFMERAAIAATWSSVTRVSLGRVPDPADLLVLDAFGSDLSRCTWTREALSLFLSRLKPDGALVHLNRPPATAPVLASAKMRGRLTIFAFCGADSGTWIRRVVMARTREDLGGLSQDARWSSLVASPSTPLWTDDFSNILSVLTVR